MSDFLMIVPQGWTEVPFEWIEWRMGFESAQQTALQEMWWEFENALEGVGQLQEGQTIERVKLFMAEDGPKCWIMFRTV